MLRKNTGSHGKTEIHSGTRTFLQSRFGTDGHLVVPKIEGDVISSKVKSFIDILKILDKKAQGMRSDHDDQEKLNSSQILKQWTLTSNVSVCPIPVTGRMLEIRLRGCKARPKPLLIEFQRKRRLTYAREHSLWTIKHWENVIFSDKSQFCFYGNQSSAYVRRHTHDEFSPQCLKPTVKYPKKVMVWGCISSHGVDRLHIVSGTVKAMDYIEKLQNKLLPTARDLFGNQSWIFQDDNAPCYRAKVVQKWLKDHTANRMNWPGQCLPTLIR
ncbi:transposable element Tcb1 transposase [Trichonephila clavipes]|nr:transposable element Tcb1 transposase [Trichonephila clavipes]